MSLTSFLPSSSSITKLGGLIELSICRSRGQQQHRFVSRGCWATKKEATTEARHKKQQAGGNTSACSDEDEGH